MDRSQKRCLLAAAGGHVFLFLVMAFGSAFLNHRPDADELPKMKFVPTLLIEQMLAGGGGVPDRPITDEAPAGGSAAPVATAPPIPVPPAPDPELAKIVEPTPSPTPPDPTPPPPVLEKIQTPRPTPVTPTKKQPKVEKPKPTPEATVRPVDIAKPSPKKTTPEIDLNHVVTRPNDDSKRKAKDAADKKAQAKAQEEADRQAQKAYADARAAGEKRRSAVASSLAALGEGFSKDTGVKVDIGGPGGMAYANYGAFVVKVYDKAWQLSSSLGDSDSTTEVSVTVLRNGDILNARITRKSGMPALDKSVESALAAVKSIHRAFPEGSTDEQRTFTIRFNLKSKRQTG